MTGTELTELMRDGEWSDGALARAMGVARDTVIAWRRRGVPSRRVPTVQAVLRGTPKAVRPPHRLGDLVQLLEVRVGELEAWRERMYRQEADEPAILLAEDEEEEEHDGQDDA